MTWAGESSKRVTGIAWYEKDLVGILDLSGCTALSELRCYGSQLTDLDVSNCTQLEHLYCNDNKLTTLNVDGCAQLKYLWCEENRLTFADLPLGLPVSGGTYLYSSQADMVIGSGGVVMVGEVIDLSSQFSVGGVRTVFRWYADDYTEITPTEADNGKFAFGPEFAGRRIHCVMTNEALPALGLETTSVVVTPTHWITLIRPTDANDESHPVNINSGSLVIARIYGDMSAVSRVTISMDGGEKRDVVSSGNIVYYLLPAGLESGEHTIAIELTTAGGQTISEEVTFHWDSYRRGFGFGRLVQ